MKRIKSWLWSMSRYATWWKYIILAIRGARRMEIYDYNKEMEKFNK